tara:strand:- start:152 stop:427 length:276 start_codon:yes stop_codon:yes gene_type:complete
METKKIDEKDLQQIKTLNEEKNRMVVDFGRLKTDIIMVEAKLKELVKMEEDMVAEFKGNETKASKLISKLNKKYGGGQIDIDKGTFTPSPK